MVINYRQKTILESFKTERPKKLPQTIAAFIFQNYNISQMPNRKRYRRIVMPPLMEGFISFGISERQIEKVILLFEEYEVFIEGRTILIQGGTFMSENYWFRCYKCNETMITLKPITLPCVENVILTISAC